MDCVLEDFCVKGDWAPASGWIHKAQLNIINTDSIKYAL